MLLLKYIYVQNKVFLRIRLNVVEYMVDILMIVLLSYYQTRKCCCLSAWGEYNPICSKTLRGKMQHVVTSPTFFKLIVS